MVYVFTHHAVVIPITLISHFYSIKPLCSGVLGVFSLLSSRGSSSLKLKLFSPYNDRELSFSSLELVDDAAAKVINK